jgi:hypothetical protein
LVPAESSITVTGGYCYAPSIVAVRLRNELEECSNANCALCRVVF